MTHTRRARGAGVAAVLAVVLGAAACSSSSRTVTPPSRSSSTSVTAVASSSTTKAPRAEPACSPSAAYAAGTARHTMRVDGVTREFLVHVPPHLSRRTLLIVDFHGATSSMQAQDIYSGLDPIADTKDFVVATPNGLVTAGVRQWNFLSLADVHFAVAIATELANHACVDARRVFATGISSGGAMTAALACRASQTFAGFAPVAADFYIPSICDNAGNRPMLIFHGTADPVVPYFGGRIATGNGLPVQPAEATAARWAKHNLCTVLGPRAGPTATRLGTEAVRLSWTGCVAPVVMYRIVGGGHTWPGAAIAAPLGKTTHQISASAEMVKLFESS